MYESLTFLNNGFSAFAADPTKQAVGVLTKVAKQLSKLSPTALTAALYSISVNNPTLYASLLTVGGFSQTGNGLSSTVPPTLTNTQTGAPVVPYQNNGQWYAVTNDPTTGASILAVYQPGLGWTNTQTGQLVNQPSYQNQYTYQLPQQSRQPVFNPNTGQYVDPVTGIPVNQPPSNQYAAPFYQNQSYTPYYGQQPGYTPYYGQQQQPSYSQYYSQPSYSPYYGQQQSGNYVPYPVLPTYQNPYPSDPSSSINDLPVYDSSGVPVSTLNAIRNGLQQDATGLANSSDVFNIDPFSSFPTIYPYGAAPVAGGYLPWAGGGLMVAVAAIAGFYFISKKKHKRTRRVRRSR